MRTLEFFEFLIGGGLEGKVFATQAGVGAWVGQGGEAGLGVSYDPWFWAVLLVALIGLGMWLQLGIRYRRRERELARSEARLRHVFEHAPVAILEEDFTPVKAWLEGVREGGVTDIREYLASRPEDVRERFKQLRVVQANQMALQITGAKSIEHYSSILGRLLTPRVQSAFTEELVAIWEGRNELLVNMVHRHPDDRATHSVLHWSVPMVEGRSDYSRVLLVFSDITALRQAQAKLQESEDRWQLAVQGINAGLWEQDLANGSAFWSGRCREILGYAQDDLSNDPEVWHGLIHPEDREAWEAATDEWLKGRTTNLRVEMRMRALDGQYRWVLSRGKALFDERGKALRIVGTYSDVHARKVAEGALRASEARLRQVVTQADCMLWSATVTRSLEGVLKWEFCPLELSVRSSLHRLCLRTNQGYLWGEAELPDVVEMDRKASEAIMSGERSYRHEYRVKAKGEIVWVRESVEIVEAEPEHWQLVGVVFDVTATRLAVESLRRVKERWEAALHGSQDGIWEFDYETNEVFYSDRWKSMLGYAPEEIGADREEWLSRVHPEDRGRVVAAYDEHLAGRSPTYSVEFRMRCKDGAYKWILARGRVRFGEDGKPRLAAGSHTDITERIRATETLAAERERLSVTLRAMTEAVITTDAEGRVLYMNHAAEVLTGWSNEQAQGQPLIVVCQIYHPKTRAPLGRFEKTAMSDRAAYVFPAASVLMPKKGGTRQVDGACVPLLISGAGASGVVLALRDVTERMEMEAEIIKAARLESVGVLAGGIAHDFNNLLTVVMGNLTLAMMDSQVMTNAGGWLTESEKGLVRARDLTQQLLAFAKGGDPVRKSVGIGEIVREAAEFSLHGANVRGDIEIGASLWSAIADKGQIGQVVQNLVINAVQAMPEGGVIKLKLQNELAPPERTGMTGPTLLLTIKDTGKGIRPEHLGRIFDPYFTTKKTGSGLGLATVYNIVQKHGGYIEVDSQVGQGTGIRIWIPATDTAVSNAPFAEPVHVPHEGKLRILFMDDEPTIREMAGHLLTRLGFEVETVEDGQAAVSRYQAALKNERGFDLVIMDLTVPGGMGGREAMQELLKLDPGVKAIVSSGFCSDPVMADHRAYGFRGVVPKPYKITDLAKAIRSVLES